MSIESELDRLGIDGYLEAYRRITGRDLPEEA